MKRVTKVYLSTEKQDTQMCFDTYEDFAKCAGFWWDSGDVDYYYSEESIIFKMYKASVEMLCTVERVVNGVTVRIVTDWK